MELLVRPTCDADRDRFVLLKVAAEFGVELQVVDLWKLTDSDVDSLPLYLSSLIKPAREGKIGLLDHGWLFINGVPVKADWHNETQLGYIKDHLKRLSNGSLRHTLEGSKQ
jgi:hypothetical protein